MKTNDIRFSLSGRERKAYEKRPLLLRIVIMLFQTLFIHNTLRLCSSKVHVLTPLRTKDASSLSEVSVCRAQSQDSFKRKFYDETAPAS